MENMILSLFELSLGASLVILLMLLVAPLAGKKLSAKWRYWIWLALALRLLLPIQIDLPRAAMTVELPETMTQAVESALPGEDAFPTLGEAVPAVPELGDEPVQGDIILETIPLEPIIHEEVKPLWTVTPLQLIATVWALGAAATLIWQCLSYSRYLNKMQAWNRPVIDEDVLNLYEELCLELGIRNMPELLQNRRSQSPMLIGLRKPAIVLPEMNYSEDDYVVILSHELNHYKRHDLWYKLLVLAALCIHWFNPLVWIMLREADNDLEITCDEAVVRNSSNDDRAHYCEAILRIMCRGKGNYALLSTGVNGGKKVLQRRFAAVLNEGAGKGLVIGAMALCLVLLSGTFVACQVSEPEEPVVEKEPTAMEMTLEQLNEIDASVIRLTKDQTQYLEISGAYGKQAVLDILEKVESYEQDFSFDPDAAEELFAISIKDQLYIFQQSGADVLLSINEGAFEDNAKEHKNWLHFLTLCIDTAQWYRVDEELYDMTKAYFQDLSHVRYSNEIEKITMSVHYDNIGGSWENEIIESNLKARIYEMIRFDLIPVDQVEGNPWTGSGNLILHWKENGEIKSYTLQGRGEHIYLCEGLDWKEAEAWNIFDEGLYLRMVDCAYAGEQPQAETQMPAATAPNTEEHTGTYSGNYLLTPFQKSFQGLDIHSSEFYNSINFYTVDSRAINSVLSSLDWTAMPKTQSARELKTDDPDSTGPYIRFVTDNMEQLYLYKNLQIALYRNFAGERSYYNMPEQTYEEVMDLLKEVSTWKLNPVTEERGEPFDENYSYLDIYNGWTRDRYSLTVRTFCEMLIEDLNWTTIATRDYEMETPTLFTNTDDLLLHINSENGRHLYIYNNDTAVYYTGHGNEHCFRLKTGSYHQIKSLLENYKLYANPNVEADSFYYQESFQSVSVSVNGGEEFKLDRERSFRMMAGVPTGYFKQLAKGVSFGLEGQNYVLLRNFDGRSIAFVEGRSQVRVIDGNGKVSYYELGADYYDIALMVANTLVKESYGRELRYNPPTGQDTDLDHWIATRDMSEVSISLKQKDSTVSITNEEEKRELYGYLRKMEKMTTPRNPTAAYSEPVTITITSSDVNGSYVYDPNNMGSILQGSDGQYQVDNCIEDIMAKYFGSMSITSTHVDSNPATAKPVIYLYPEKTTEVSIQLDYNGKLTTTYPAYRNGWTVTAQPDGRISDGKREYYCLFWEGISAVDYDLSSGFVVKGSETEAFLEKALSQLGLTDAEANEFIIYWLPRMEGNPYNLISFQEEQYTDNAKLTVSPEPDSILRVFMAWKALEKPVTVPAQELKGFERKGFTLVEWGGSEM